MSLRNPIGIFILDDKLTSHGPSCRARLSFLPTGRFCARLGEWFSDLAPFLLFVSLLCVEALGQAPLATDLQVGHDFWGFKEGAPDDVFALAQTSDGLLWLGTASGLFRFDGTRFELFHSSFGDQLLSTNVYALFAPPSGGLWIGYAIGGFSFLKDGKLTNYRGETTLASGSARNFAQGKDEVVWAATTSGLWRFDHSRWLHIGPETSIPPGPFAEVRFDRKGTLWALTGSAALSAGAKLVYLRTGSRQFQMARSNLPADGSTLDADGYIVTSPESESLFDDATANAADRPAAYPVLRKGSAQIIDRTGSVWIVLEEPVVMRLPASGRRLPDALAKASPRNSETYNLNPSFTAKLVDREGNIWFGGAKGLDRFFYSPLRKQALPKSAAESAFFSVTPDDDGVVWITAGNFTDTTLTSWPVIESRMGEVKSFRATPGSLTGFGYRASDKTLWFGGQSGLWHLVKGNLRRVNLPKEMIDKAHFLQTITQDRLGGMWVSFGREGLYRLADGVWTAYGGREDLPKTMVLIEFTDSLGRVWFGCTKNTLAVLDGDRVRVIGPKDGLGVGNVTAIYGRGSEIWIGGEFGLQRFDHGRFYTIHATNQELLRGISGIVETGNEDLWLNGLGGIFHLRRSELSEALNNPDYQVKGEHFGRREGLLGVAPQFRPLNTAIEGSDGRLWFTTSGGVEWLDPGQSENKVPAPPITIQSVSADDKNYPLGSVLKFPAHTSSVQINYAAVSLSDPEAIHFRYKLQETDKDWHEVGTASPVSYRNLAPGSYHFSVNATDTNGVWSDEVAKEEFTILPAFYQTGWFLATCIVTAAAALYLIFQLRLRQVAHQVRGRMEERLAERERIARDLHDTLLQSVQGLILKFHAVARRIPERDSARQDMEKALDYADQVLAEGRDRVRNLRSRAPALSDLPGAFQRIADEMSRGNGTNFKTILEGNVQELHPIIREESYSIGREAIINALQHSEGRNIEVEIMYDSQQFRLRVRDDGRGIDPDVLKQGGRVDHWGLRGMRERADRIGARLELRSRSESGTEVELTVPAAMAYRLPRGTFTD
jgi:signal transduction histidine kinase/ligand-binding sensor domain-containing protein